ncbi:hypothetical protein [Gracilibacillus boraciitolerans]|uniref:hypothetical protein n=1 Tax=Gracilibacillus boraciitolerans TaxID=307521 RepID=UPI000551B811|nr:hypothetical protein [Gracilibacillus boraciitolerans]
MDQSGHFEMNPLLNNRFGLPTSLSGGACSSTNFVKKNALQSGFSDHADPPGVEVDACAKSNSTMHVSGEIPNHQTRFIVIILLESSKRYRS